MCGLAGLVDRHPLDPELATRIVAEMADTLIHRGPDDAGTHLDPAGRLALAHRRLAIIDLSPAGHQPMTSRSGRWTVAFNGEIYNHHRIRDDLLSHGAVFRGHGDTETLVEAIDRWGLCEALDRTNGMFALAAWDARSHRLTLARDRLGEKPLYWQHDEGRLTFASELRALRALPDVDLRVDPHAVTAMLRWSFIPHPQTIYTGVRQLPPGGLLDVDVNDAGIAVAEKTWWSLGATVDTAVRARRPQTVDAAAEELEPLLADAVALRLESDVPLGSFLSGGIDSSLIAALAQRTSPLGGLRTFTVSMPDLGFDESAHAAAVARHLGTRHQTVHLAARDAFDLIPRLPGIWDEPFGDPSMLPTALLCAAARRELSVCLGGDGGDEMFAGYNRHALGASMHRRMGWLPTGVRHAAASAVTWPQPSTVDAAVRGVARLLPPSRRLPNPGDKLQKAGALLRSDGSAWESLAEIWPRSSLGVVPTPPRPPKVECEIGGVEQMMLTDTSSVLPDQMLVKLDRASMAVSLEVRAPFVDHRLLEWSWRQPVDVKTSGGVGKLVLRKVAEQVLPPEIVRRPKMGFDPPLRGWLRNELRPWAADLVARPRAVEEGWVDGAAVQQVWNEHQSGRRNWDYRLWSLLMLEAWLAEHHPG